MHVNEPFAEVKYSQDSEEMAVSMDQLAPPPPPEDAPAAEEKAEQPHAEKKVHKHRPASGEIGIIYGNVGTTNFNILLTGKIEKLEYIQTEHEEHGWMLGQIIEITRHTDLSADKADLLAQGQEMEIEEKEIAQVTLIGYRDDRNLLQSPRTPLKAGSKVFKATPDLIKSAIGLKENTPTGAYIGLLAGHDIRIELDINKLVSKHVSILAMTGQGKSYCSGVFIEELLKHDVTTLIIDPHGEYGTLTEKGKVQRTERPFNVQPRGYAGKVVEFAANTQINPGTKALKFTLSSLDARDILSLTNIKNARTYLTSLMKVVDQLKDAKGTYTLDDIITVISSDEEQTNATLIAELEGLKAAEIFDEKGTKIDELIQKGRTTIINLKGETPDIQELIVNRICTNLFELRKANKIPPMMIIVEECHNFCPQQGVANSTRILRSIASEGRKFGLGLTLISQRPAKVDKNVLSQCNTQIILKVQNPNDLKAISSSIEGLTEAMEEEIQRLPTGTAIVTGAGTTMPLFVDIRPRETKHGGESIEVVPTKGL